MPNSELGFAEVPWDVESANAGSLEGLPPAPQTFVGATVCLSEWASNPSSGTWMCTRPTDHDGTHRAGDSVGTVAEWRDEDQVRTATRPDPAGGPA